LPHRINLSDGILIKDNHIDSLAKGINRIEGIKLAIMRAQAYRTSKDFLPIGIEVDTEEEAIAAAKTLRGLKGPNIILLDNMPAEQVSKTAKSVRSVDSKILIEASGGIKEDNIGEYLKAGADYISTSLFMSAEPCSFKLEITR
jgi:nicotinate-nucleotide pyrophosphorylase (carboxylating)